MNGTTRRAAWSIVSLLVLIAFAHSTPREATPDVHIVTVDALCRGQITNFVGQPIRLRTKLLWEYADAKIPEDPTPWEELQKKIAGELTTAFENYSLYARGVEFQDEPERGRLKVVSKHLKRKPDAKGVEQFAFKDRVLLRATTDYVLRGKLKYRDWLRVDSAMAARIKNQSDNPVYWSQTFEFVLDDIE